MTTRGVSIQFVGLALSILLAPRAALALGGDHPSQPVTSSSWPKGMAALVNSPERVHGYFVNAEDVFFFAGSQNQFNKFLRDYAKIDGVVNHKVVVRAGVGRAKSPWQKGEGVRCDWMIYACPASWKERRPDASGYIIEVHVWDQGSIPVDQDRVPRGVTIQKAGETEPDGAATPRANPMVGRSLR